MMIGIVPGSRVLLALLRLRVIWTPTFFQSDSFGFTVVGVVAR